MLIKDNHITVAGSIKSAVERVRGVIGHLVKVEIEVDTLAQLEDALAVGVDAVLLDNMDPEELRLAVAMVGGRALTEAAPQRLFALPTGKKKSATSRQLATR